MDIRYEIEKLKLDLAVLTVEVKGIRTELDIIKTIELPNLKMAVEELKAKQ
jgi:hypothetical protein